MSHKATNWAISQRGLKPATKLVLWHLCDRHHADHGCFPSQETLAEDCEMSRSGLNNHLNELERVGLIKRIQRSDKASRRQKSTLYLMAFEFENAAENASKADGASAENEGGSSEKSAPETTDSDARKSAKPCPKFRHGAVSKKTQKPCPKNGKSRVQSLDTNPVREPVREPTCANGKPFFTADERSEAAEVCRHFHAGSSLNWAGVKRRVIECIIAENLLTSDERQRAGIF